MTNKQKEKKNYTLLIYLGILLMGFLLGALFVYKVEINTLNQVLDSLRYCYETYGGFK